jgi:hypothetical protein
VVTAVLAHNGLTEQSTLAVAAVVARVLHKAAEKVVMVAAATDLMPEVVVQTVALTVQRTLAAAVAVVV